jgi:hypothetical protein
MSQSLASAKKRRAGIQPNDPVMASKQMPQPGVPQKPGQPNGTSALTLPQVIQVVDKRLIVLETFMKETKSNMNATPSKVTFSDMQPQTTRPPTEKMTADLQEIIEEFDKRYDMLAEEIANIKDIVLNLQTYTMGVNKMLLEDRGVITEEEDAEKKIEENVSMSLTGLSLESLGSM